MEVEFFGILSGGNVVEYWMSSPCQAIYLYIQVFHLGISDTVTLVFTRQSSDPWTMKVHSVSGKVERAGQPIL